MTEQEIYNQMLKKINMIKENIEDCAYYLNEFNDKMNEALKINNSDLYKKSIESIKNDLIYKKDELRLEVIPEIETKII